MTTILLALLFCHCSLGLLTPLTKSNGDLDIDNLSSILAAVEKTVTYLQSREDALERKHTAMISNVLSELAKVKQDHAHTKSQLAKMTIELGETKARLDIVEDTSKVCESNLTRLTDEMRGMRHDQETSKQELALLQRNISSVEMRVNSVTQLTSNVSKLLAWQKHVDPLITDHESGIMQLQSRIHTVHDLMHEMNTSQTQSGIEADKLRRNIYIVEGDLTKLTSSVNTINSTVRDFSRVQVNKNPHVAFQARMNNWTAGQMLTRVQFGRISYNAGSGYNINGVFTVPVTGTYLLWASLSFKADQHASYNIFLKILSEGTVVSVAYRSPSYRTNSKDSDFNSIVFDMLSTTVLATLKTGDTIFVRTNVRTMLKQEACSFGGALLN